MKAVDAVFTTPPVECGWIYRKLMGASTKWSILLILLWHEKAPLLFFLSIEELEYCKKPYVAKYCTREAQMARKDVHLQRKQQSNTYDRQQIDEN